jgi:UDP-N-acetylmuramyl tripeptide synthase
MSWRQMLAVAVARLAGGLSSLLRLGSGSSLPGMVALRLAPDLLGQMGRALDPPVIAITGTNGKTTTSGLTSQLLARLTHSRVLHNTLGANMRTGITTALLAHVSPWTGKLQCRRAVLEVDEASLRRVADDVGLTHVTVTNLFRDQLDRYGELDTTARLILEGIGPARHMVLNADDPLVAAMADAQGGSADALPPVYYGLGAETPALVTYGRHLAASSGASGALEITAPAPMAWDPVVDFPREGKQCPRCGQALAYSTCYYGHLGLYTCPGCGFSRPRRPQVYATRVCLTPTGSEVDLCCMFPGEGRGWQQTVWLPLAGLFNVYNLLAAVATVGATCDNPADILPVLTLSAEDATIPVATVFGRSETQWRDGRRLVTMLIKNPVGASEVLRLVTADPEARLMLALNDLDADGRDVSWIWDASFEALAGFPRPIVVSGRRAQDMAVRLKYAGVPDNHLRVEPDLHRALNLVLENTPASPEVTLYVLPTYTALLALRQKVSQ